MEFFGDGGSCGGHRVVIGPTSQGACRGGPMAHAHRGPLPKLPILYPTETTSRLQTSIGTRLVRRNRLAISCAFDGNLIPFGLGFSPCRLVREVLRKVLRLK